MRLVSKLVIQMLLVHNLAASAKRGNKRLIGIMIGAKSSNDRLKKMSNILDLSFKLVQEKS